MNPSMGARRPPSLAADAPRASPHTVPPTPQRTLIARGASVTTPGAGASRARDGARRAYRDVFMAYPDPGVVILAPSR